MSFLRLLGAAGALLLVLASPAAAHKRHHHHHNHKDVTVQLLSFNDFHGNLQTSTAGGIRLDPPTTPPTSKPAGGAAILATYLRELRRGHRNSLTVAAGDLIGGACSGAAATRPTAARTAPASTARRSGISPRT